MMRLKNYLWLVLVLTVFPTLDGARVQAQSIRWHTDYATARKEAAKQSKPLVIDFYMVPCGPCQRLVSEVFSQPHIAKMMNEKFIPLKLNGPHHPKLTTALNIDRFPTVVLADSDGRILGTMQGFQEASRFHKNLQTALLRVANPEWMVRDYWAANKAANAKQPDYAKAISLLKHITDDGKRRPIQNKAWQFLDQIEQQATQELARARQMRTSGNTTDAMDILTKLVSVYPGTRSAGQASVMLKGLAKSPQAVHKSRVQVAQELFGEAKEYYDKQRFSPCLDVCQQLVDEFGDLPPAEKARQMQDAIQTNTAWMQKSCDELSNKLSRRLLLLANAYLQKQQRDRAMMVYEQIQNMFPDSRDSQIALYHLRQLRGEPTVPVDFQRKKRD